MPLWFSEHASEDHRMEWRVRRVLHSGRSAFQEIAILDTSQFGPSLVLDGIMQTTKGDEFIYHEMLAWVPLSTHPAPRGVLIVGGGDGGTVREVLSAPGVERAVLVEIDREVVALSRRYLPDHAASLDDPRLTIIYEDGAAYLERAAAEGGFDLILVDATDPEGNGPGRVLYTPRFHESVRRALAPGGLFVQHTGAPLLNPEVVTEVAADVARRFPVCRVYWATVPTYPGGMFTFTMGSLGPDPLAPARRVRADRHRWYSPEVHRAAFALPPIVGAMLPPSVAAAQRDPP